MIVRERIETRGCRDQAQVLIQAQPLRHLCADGGIDHLRVHEGGEESGELACGPHGHLRGVVRTTVVAEAVEKGRAAQTQRLDALAHPVVADLVKQSVYRDGIPRGRRHHGEVFQRQGRCVQMPPQTRGLHRLEAFAFDDLERIESTALEAGSHLDQQRHHSETRDRHRDMVVAGEHVHMVVEVDDVHRDLRPGVDQALQRTQRGGERPASGSGASGKPATGALRAATRTGGLLGSAERLGGRGVSETFTRLESAHADP